MGHPVPGLFGKASPEGLIRIAPRANEYGEHSLMKILVIDDDPQIRRFLERVLEQEHQVVTAQDGKAALAQLSEQSFDAVIADVNMPVMNGRELYQQLVQQKHPLRDRFVFISGWIVSKEDQKFIESIGKPILYKPFDIEALKTAVRAVSR